MATDNDTEVTVQTTVLRVTADDDVGKNLERQADEMGERGFVLRSSFLLVEDVICVYQRID